MDFGFSKEEQLIQKAAREFADKRIVPVAQDIRRNNAMPGEILSGLAELGMFGIPFPETYGGGEAGYLSYILALEQLSKASAGVGMVISVNTVGQAVINVFGTEEQKQAHLPPSIDGKKIMSFAFTEPGTGSDPKQLTTTVTKDGNSYILNGTKRFISNAGHEGPMVVVAKENDTGKATAFVIEKFCEGYSLSEPWKKIGAHGGGLYDVYFKDVKIPAENMVGRNGDGLMTLKTAMVYGKIGLAGLFLGRALAALEDGIRYATEKTHRGEPIGRKFEHIKISVSDMMMKYDAAKWHAYHLGWAADHYRDPMQLMKEAALSKVFVAETAIDIARISMGIHGSYGLMDDYPISHTWGDVVIGPQVEGTAPLLKIMGAGIILNG
ncbi:MAG: acyl-CoA dehydrogenase [Syntrophaceae bacterium]|nr:acyl-CoA dehydrogenase [Syntrophaceae bacterium]